MAFLAGDLGGVEAVSEGQSVQNGSLIKGILFTRVGAVTVDKVVSVHEMLRFLMETDGFTRN